MVYGLVDFIIYAKKIVDEINNGELNPDFLTQNQLLLFRRFKTAYDNKDVDGIGATISSTFRCSFYGNTTKNELIKFFKQTFSNLPVGINPKLIITLYQIHESSDEGFRGIIQFNSRLAILGVPIQKFDSGHIICEAKPEGEHSIWTITRLESI